MVVRLSGVSVRFGDTVALDRVDLAVEPGERVGVLGSSGAGKTTLLGVLCGLVPPDSGRVELFGDDLAQLRGRRLRAHRSRVGAISQHLDMALPLRVVHNVNAGRLGRWSTGAALWSLVRPSGRVQAAEVLDAVGLADRLLDRTDELSGGQRQRVAAARVLRQQPDLVLADEPTSSVDPRLADQVMALLCPPADGDGWTTVACLHDPELARRHATRLVGLQWGRVVFDGPPDTVSDGAVADLYASDDE